MKYCLSSSVPPSPTQAISFGACQLQSRPTIKRSGLLEGVRSLIPPAILGSSLSCQGAISDRQTESKRPFTANFHSPRSVCASKIQLASAQRSFRKKKLKRIKLSFDDPGGGDCRELVRAPKCLLWKTTTMSFSKSYLYQLERGVTYWGVTTEAPPLGMSDCSGAGRRGGLWVCRTRAARRRGAKSRYTSTPLTLWEVCRRRRRRLRPPSES